MPVISLDSSQMLDNFLEVLNFNQLILKLNRFISLPTAGSTQSLTTPFMVFSVTNYLKLQCAITSYYGSQFFTNKSQIDCLNTI